MPRLYLFNLKGSHMSHDKAQSYVNSVLLNTVEHHPFMVVTTQHRGLPCSGRDEADVRNWVQHRWPDCTILYVDPIHGPPKHRG